MTKDKALDGLIESQRDAKRFGKRVEELEAELQKAQNEWQAARERRIDYMKHLETAIDRELT
jgi:hypothetical protein